MNVYEVMADCASVKLVTRDGVEIFYRNGVGDGSYNVIVAYSEDEFANYVINILQQPRLRDWQFVEVFFVPPDTEISLHDYDCDPSNELTSFGFGEWWVYRNDGDVAFVRQE